MVKEGYNPKPLLLVFCIQKIYMFFAFNQLLELLIAWTTSTHEEEVGCTPSLESYWAESNGDFRSIDPEAFNRI